MIPRSEAHNGIVKMKNGKSEAGILCLVTLCFDELCCVMLGWVTLSILSVAVGKPDRHTRGWKLCVLTLKLLYVRMEWRS